MLSKDIKSIVNKYWSYEHEKYNKLKEEYSKKCCWSLNYVIYIGRFFNWRFLKFNHNYSYGYSLYQYKTPFPNRYIFSSGLNSIDGYK